MPADLARGWCCRSNEPQSVGEAGRVQVRKLRLWRGATCCRCCLHQPAENAEEETSNELLGLKSFEPVSEGASGLPCARSWTILSVPLVHSSRCSVPSEAHRLCISVSWHGEVVHLKATFVLPDDTPGAVGTTKLFIRCTRRTLNKKVEKGHLIKQLRFLAACACLPLLLQQQRQKYFH